MWRPLTSKSIETRAIILEHSTHRKRLSRVSSRIDNNPPKSMSHVKANAKGQYIKEDKKNSIQNSNKILVDRLLKVTTRECNTQRPHRSAGPNRQKKIEEVSRLTTENHRILNKIKTSRPHYSAKSFEKEYKYSLNLRKMITQNAKRVPKVLNFTNTIFEPFLDQYKSTKNLSNTLNNCEYFI